MARAETPLREQVIALRAGWNAVYLEVTPAEPSPARLLAGTPIDTVAAFFAQTHPSPYLLTPGDAPWREEGWGVWHPADRSESAVNSLHEVLGQRPYLVHSERAFEWRVSGRVALRPIRWQPNSYSFIGFSLDPQSPPTFAEFFGPSLAHRGQRVYRLIDDVWTPVRDAAQTRMRAGEAYWVYTAGGSDYQGPLRVRLIAGEAIDFGMNGRDARVEVQNAGSQEARVVIEPVGTVSDPLPLAYLTEDLATLKTSFPSFPARLELPRLAGGGASVLRVAALREKMTTESQSTLLRISNGAGVQIWLSVSAKRIP